MSWQGSSWRSAWIGNDTDRVYYSFMQLAQLLISFGSRLLRTISVKRGVIKTAVDASIRDLILNVEQRLAVWSMVKD